MLFRSVLWGFIFTLFALSFFNVISQTSRQTRDGSTEFPWQRSFIPFLGGQRSDRPLFCSSVRRLIFLEKFCRRNSIVRHPNGSVSSVPHGTPDFNFTNLFVDEKLKLLVSAKPSVAALFWRMVHASTEGNIPEHLRGWNQSDNQVLRSLNVSAFSDIPKRNDKHRILHTFTRVLVVQHPFSHLAKLHSKINRRFQLRSQAAISFREFARFVIDQNQSMVHELKTIRDSSQACKLNYHLILRVESLQEDLLPLVYMLNPRQNIRALQANMLNYLRHETHVMSLHKEYDALNATEIRDLLTMYRQDMKMFGYSLNATERGMLAICQYSQLKCC